MSGCRKVLGFVLNAVFLALSLVACVGREDEVTIDNRTTKDVVIVTTDSYSFRYLVPACGRIVINESDGAKPLESSAPMPPGAIVIEHSLPGHFETATTEWVSITSDRIWNEGGPLPSLPPCEGVPPTPPA